MQLAQLNAKKLMSKVKLFTIEIFILLFSCLVSLYIAEGFLRFFFTLPRPLASYYPLEAAKLGKTVTADLYEFKTQNQYNPSGFRDKNITPKSIGKTRILFVGDSFTEGFGVNEYERFSNVSIQNLGPQYEGINIGQLATNPNHYFNNITEFGIALKPDIIVMGIFLGNDFQGGRNLSTPEKYTVVSQLPSLSRSKLVEFIRLQYLTALFEQLSSGKKYLLKNINLESKNFWDLYFQQDIDKKFWEKNLGLSEQKLDQITLNFNQDVIRAIYSGKLLTGIFNEAINNKLGIIEPDPFYIEADYKNTLEYINESKKIADEASIKFLVLIIPDINQVHPDKFREIFINDFSMNSLPPRFKQLEKFRYRLVDDLTKNHITFLDTTDALRKSPKLNYYLYDNHMNESGHMIVGNLVSKKLGTLVINGD